MAVLHSDSQTNFMNQQTDHPDGFRPPKKPKRQHTKKPNANSADGQQLNSNPNTDLAAHNRHLRYQKRVRINEVATGDNADTLREKRRWVQKEFEASRLDGKATRELQDLYAKRNIGKIEHQRKLAQNLTNAAKEAKQRLEEIIGKGGPLLADVSALGELSDNEDLFDTSGDEAMEDTGNMETADVNLSKGDEHATYRIAAFPYYLSVDNDAIARQRALALGLELADYSAPPDQGTGARMDNMDDMQGEDEVKIKTEGKDEVKIKIEGEHEVEIKMENNEDV